MAWCIATVSTKYCSYLSSTLRFANTIDSIDPTFHLSMHTSQFLMEQDAIRLMCQSLQILHWHPHPKYCNGRRDTSATLPLVWRLQQPTSHKILLSDCEHTFSFPRQSSPHNARLKSDSQCRRRLYRPPRDPDWHRTYGRRLDMGFIRFWNLVCCRNQCCNCI